MNTNGTHHAEQIPCIFQAIGLPFKHMTAEPTASNVPEQQQEQICIIQHGKQMMRYKGLISYQKPAKYG